MLANAFVSGGDHAPLTFQRFSCRDFAARRQHGAGGDFGQDRRL